MEDDQEKKDMEKNKKEMEKKKLNEEGNNTTPNLVSNEDNPVEFHAKREYPLYPTNNP